MKKIIVLSVLSLVLTACGDEYSKFRKLTVDDYKENPELREEMTAICKSGKITNSQIEDFEMCSRAYEAHPNYHSPW